ncbi:hypothetical protein Tco_0793013 [Tanacetum coccineum]
MKMDFATLGVPCPFRFGLLLSALKFLNPLLEDLHVTWICIDLKIYGEGRIAYLDLSIDLKIYGEGKTASVNEEGGDVQVHEESASEHKNHNVVDRQQKHVREQQSLMHYQQTSYGRGEGSNSPLNQINGNMDVDENMRENQ